MALSEMYPAFVAVALLQVLCATVQHRRLRLFLELRAFLLGTIEGAAFLERTGDAALLADVLPLVLRTLENAGLIKSDAANVSISRLGSDLLANPSFDEILEAVERIFVASGGFIEAPALARFRSLRLPDIAHEHAIGGLKVDGKWLRANVATQRVYFCTDRSAASPSDPTELKFTGDRSQDGAVTLGYLDVSIPRDHRLARLESPNLLRFDFKANPLRHITPVDGARVREDDFISRLSRSNLLIFIHGYNVGFNDAICRVAQLTYDLTYNGNVLCYSWPSQGELLRYTIDETNSEWTAEHLLEILTKLRSTGMVEIDVIAHSMGTRSLLFALARHKEQRSRQLTNIILAAPDVDAEIMRQNVAALRNAARSTTVYASSRDTALAASKRVNGYLRAGDAGADIFVEPGIDTIDVSSINSDFLGHSYFGDNANVISDIHYLLQGQPLPRFRLAPVELPRGKYWRFVP